MWFLHDVYPNAELPKGLCSHSGPMSAIRKQERKKAAIICVFTLRCNIATVRGHRSPAPVSRHTGSSTPIALKQAFARVLSKRSQTLKCRCEV